MPFRFLLRIRHPTLVGVDGRAQVRFYTKEECEGWLSDRQRHKPNLTPGMNVERIEYPSEAHRFFYFAHWIASELTYRRPVLLVITEWGIWGSSENWHLYYKLRQTYGDTRLLEDAPGHLFVEHEVEDLGSFLQLSMLNGWGGYVLTEANYVNAFFSHDEYVDFFSDGSANLGGIREALGARNETRGASEKKN
jgi:hypothetical protein